MAARPIDEDEPQQTARRAGRPPPLQCLAGERRSRQRRLAAQKFDHTVPVGRIKLVRFHPELESHSQSLAYQLKLAPMGSSPGITRPPRLRLAGNLVKLTNFAKLQPIDWRKGWFTGSRPVMERVRRALHFERRRLLGTRPLLTRQF